MKTKFIRLKDLLVNTENFRFDPVDNQKEAIDQMVVNQGEKLFNLAKHIAENGIDPSSRVQVAVSNHESSKFIVLEGNRRIVALKLWTNPELVDLEGMSSLKRKFKKLHDEFREAVVSEVECTVYANPDDANKWIKLKHTGQNEGISTVEWDTHQRRRFDEKIEGKSTAAVQIIRLLENSDATPLATKDLLGSLKLTNLERLISDPAIREMLGIEISNGTIHSSLDKSEVLKGLIQVAKDLLAPNFNVKRIYTKQDREDYLKRFPKASKPDKSKVASAWIPAEKPSRASAKSNSSKSKVNPKDRRKVIPKSCKLTIGKSRVNSIYHELQKLDVYTYTNACAVLLRVFIELSIDCYRDEKRLSKGASSAGEKGTNLLQKVLQVADQLTSKGEIDQTISKGIKKEVKDTNDILGIETWHAYVHNNNFTPKPKDLVATWDSIESFVEVVWKNVE